MVYKRLNKNKKIALVETSDNYFYASYEVKAYDILEIWNTNLALLEAIKSRRIRYY
ncbi:hypothetical protein HNQ02_000669 [Flavobacterium sp. 7E]|uniref:hypothetical protein n=1 Tax=Flavobacterium sp. 7E TaxID=2735898 RepID=UPI0020C6A670|nr:hypothetical protein [Flavobacterium sp. 7E]NRS87762.1 hypothetical protein [Flavobacterium sp. 7E]